MTKYSVSKLIGSVALALPLFANATVLDFEGLTGSTATPINSVVANYGGFTWDSNFYLYQYPSYPTPTHSGSYGIINNFGVNPVSLANSSAFNFDSVWVSGWSFNAPSSIVINGYDSANNLIGSTGSISITPGSEVFVSANFTNVYRVDFVGGQYFTLDDISVNGANIPEPATAALLGLGLFGFVASRRKSKAQ